MGIDPGRGWGFECREGSETGEGVPDDAVRDRGCVVDQCGYDVGGEGHACDFTLFVESSL